MAFSKTIWNGATELAVVEGQQYLIEGYVKTTPDPINKPFLIRMLFKPNSYSLLQLDNWVQLVAASSDNVWTKLTTTFTAKDSNPVKIGLYQEYSNEGTNTIGNADSVIFTGPLDQLTEKKTIIYDSGCLYKNFHVKFLDSLGGYSYWTFRTYSDKGVSFGDSKQIKRNIFSDFPTTFKDAQVQSDFLNVQSKDTITLRAENLTEQQANDLFELVRSVRVYDINDLAKPKVLLVDKNSVRYTQGEKLFNLTFNATYTFDNYRQRQ